MNPKRQQLMSSSHPLTQFNSSRLLPTQNWGNPKWVRVKAKSSQDPNQESDKVKLNDEEIINQYYTI